jgi:hypothetical protein
MAGDQTLTLVVIAVGGMLSEEETYRREDAFGLRHR